MRMHPNARIAMTLGAMMALAVPPAIAADMTEAERKTPPPPSPPPPPPANLPGETNRQLAARLKAEASARQSAQPNEVQS